MQTGGPASYTDPPVLPSQVPISFCPFSILMLSIRIASSFHNSRFSVPFQIGCRQSWLRFGRKKDSPMKKAACFLHDKILRLSMHVLRMHKILRYHCTGFQVTCQYQNRRNVDAELSQCCRTIYD